MVEEIESIKNNKFLSLAYDILSGKAGGEFLYCLEEDRFYMYDKGVWRHIFEVEFMGIITHNLKKLAMKTIAEKRHIIEHFKTIKYKRLTAFNWTPQLNLINGMINPLEGIPYDHHPSYYSTLRLDYNFDEFAQCELWIKTLNEILENDQNKINILQEFFGYCLTQDTKQHKALLLLGESRSGKSTILQTLRGVIGDKNCSSVPLKYISNPQYTPMLINKLVNIDTDVSAKAAEFEAEFKTITSGEPVSANQKFVAAFDFIPYCKIVMAANIFPKITDHSSAFYKRLILIPCDRVFTDNEQNRNLASELKNELPGILNWAIEGLKRINDRGRFEQLDFMKDAIQDLEDENNPTNLFFDEHIIVEMGSQEEKGYLFDKYKDWCDKSKNYILSKARFSSCVYKRYHKETPKDTQNLETKKRIWRNIKYVDVKYYIKQENIDWQK